MQTEISIRRNCFKAKPLSPYDADRVVGLIGSRAGTSAEALRELVGRLFTSDDFAERLLERIVEVTCGELAGVPNVFISDIRKEDGTFTLTCLPFRNGSRRGLVEAPDELLSTAINLRPGNCAGMIDTSLLSDAEKSAMVLAVSDGFRKAVRCTDTETLRIFPRRLVKDCLTAGRSLRHLYGKSVKTLPVELLRQHWYERKRPLLEQMGVVFDKDGLLTDEPAYRGLRNRSTSKAGG